MFAALAGRLPAKVADLDDQALEQAKTALDRLAQSDRDLRDRFQELDRRGGRETPIERPTATVFPWSVRSFTSACA